jgi:hypothetical protein
MRRVERFTRWRRDQHRDCCPAVRLLDDEAPRIEGEPQVRGLPSHADDLRQGLDRILPTDVAELGEVGVAGTAPPGAG